MAHSEAKLLAAGPLHANTIQALSLMFARKSMDYIDTSSLRLACRALRDAHDRAATRLRLGAQTQLFDEIVASQATSTNELTAVVRRLLARGCKPSSLDLNSPSHSHVLAFLNSLAGAESVQNVCISSKSLLTEAVARSIARGFPKLDCIDFYVPGQEPVDMADRDGPAAAQLLMQLVGPKLTCLSVSAKGHWPARALEHLAQCTALTRLVLTNSEHDTSEELGLEAESSLLRTLSSLTNLRDLELEGGARPPSDAALRRARAASLESCLSSLTALTRLDIRLRCLQHALHPSPEGRGWKEENLEGHISQLRSQGRAAEAAQLLSAVAAESRALGAALRRMPQLTELRTPARLNTSDLAALTALTYLRVGALVLPPPPPADSLDSLVVPNVYGLPPRLKELKVYSPLSVHVAASLRRSPAAVSARTGRIFWEAPGLLGYGDQPYWTLAFHDGDIDEEGRLTADAAATMSKAVTSVKAAFWLPPASLSGCGTFGLRLHVFGENRQYVEPPLATADEASGAGGDGTHCDSWLGAMAAKLRPMELKLWGFTLSACDMFGMERCLTGVKTLDLRGCHYNAASLPLLGGLAALEKLSLCSYGWAWPALDLAYRKGVLEAAFLGLTAPAMRKGAWLDGDEEAAGGGADALYGCKAALPLPRLRQLLVYCDTAVCDLYWLRRVLAGAAAELRRRRPVSAVLSVISEED